ncbi:MAG TPA: NAD-glutamate dehydrogenase [Nevskiaceae bacterium]|nr:NAD-glutamate dehydrogenase [Nevskiaceae bacterium]
MSEVFDKFQRLYYEMASPDTLRLRQPAELAATAKAHFDLASKRPGDEILLKVRKPAEGALGLACVQTVAPDMPFLVDTLTMALRAAGTSIDWSVHPVLALKRDAKGVLVDVAGLGAAAATTKDSYPESLMNFEFDPLTTPAAYDELEKNLRQVLGDLATVVADYQPMRSRVDATAKALTQVKSDVADEAKEASELLRWLDAEHFTFLGYVECLVENVGGQPRIGPPGDGLGLFRAGGRYDPTFELMAPQEELDKYAGSSRVVVVTKSNIRSPIHHAEYMDVISIKLPGEDGQTRAIRRFVGLFSSEVYTERVDEIPLVRRKVADVFKQSRLPEHSHSGKNLKEILQGLPRDELFQSSEDELFRACMGIRALRDRQQLRLFMRRDRYGRFYSCMVYLPRERYTRELRDRIAAELVAACGGLASEHNTDFLRGGFARIHVLVRTPPGTTISASTEEVEQRLISATRTWRDKLREVLTGEKGGAEIARRFAEGFPTSYTEHVAPADAAADLAYLAQLSEKQTLLPRLLVEGDATQASVTGLKLYARGKPIALSDVLPTLENFGLRIASQEPTEIRPPQGDPLYIQHFQVKSSAASGLPAESQKKFFEAAFLKAWTGEIENDGLNRLVLAAGLDWRQVSCVRLMARYLVQTGLPYSQAYMEQLLAEHAHIARLLVRLFEARFDPSIDDKKRKSDAIKIAQELDAALDKVATLDGDRVLRAFLSVVRAGLRTNYYQRRPDGSPKPCISLKLDPKQVPELPAPLPMFEIFVYAPEVEGVHLRGGKVARGGLRWSDRRQDFRTEVLGLMKAQMVKNTVIVPVGAKGGFVVKKPVDPSIREAWLNQGIECYKTFVRGLLDLTDNRVGDAVVPPKDVVRYDEDDPYLVVAADKGTATFSDIANGLSAEYSFWLGDAFASGGSAGYDHKKMGITAKGAWESVKRHFRELGKNIQEQEFSVVGIGDMSGDVFGNGMLLSHKIKLVAAFDHRHIFLDPNPDLETSFKERERMFALPRSSWADYNASLISQGGGVFPRSAKSIKLSEEIRKALDISAATVTPQELMKSILKAPVDLLWNGGIGTYVKSHLQSHQEVGDRANDAIRVNGKDLRCAVVGEGGNLGCTQLGRIEYALRGGKINTDAIDNSGGVHSSDREVNIKIPLNRLLAEGKLTRADRDPLLVSMTDDVARAVLRDNYIQSAAISLLEQNAPARLDEQANLIRTLEREGRLNRAVEFLPDDEVLKERKTQGRGLTRPEFAVLLAYSKMALFDAVLNSQVPDDPFFARDLLGYFPPKLVERYRPDLENHRLRREIISTVLGNAVVNRMGVSFAHRLAEDVGVEIAEVIKAYATAHEIFDGDQFWQSVEALDNKVPAQVQYRLFEGAIGLMKHITSWLISSGLSRKPVGEIVQRYDRPVTDIEMLLPNALPPSYREDWDRIVANMKQQGVPENYAQRLANTKALGSALDIAQLAEESKVSLEDATAVYFQVGERFQMLWLLTAIVNLKAQSKWHALARANLRDDCYRIHRRLAERVLRHKGESATERIDKWIKANESRVKFALQRLKELQTSTVLDFMTLAVGVRELRKLRGL